VLALGDFRHKERQSRERKIEDWLIDLGLDKYMSAFAEVPVV